MLREIDATQLHQLINEGLSQREIARRLDVPRSTLQDWLKRQNVAPARTRDSRTGGGAGAPQVGQLEVLPPERAPGYAIIPLDVVHTILQRFDRLEEHLHAGGGQVPQGGAGRGAGQVPQEETRVLRPSRSTRWKMSIREALLEVIRAEAEQRRIDPSKLVQEAVEAWLHVQIPER
jgi:transcriptional regulator with XRE-family HTH domain